MDSYRVPVARGLSDPRGLIVSRRAIPLFVVAAAAVLLATGCGSETDPASDDATATPTPTVTAAESPSPTPAAADDDPADDGGGQQDEADQPAASGNCAAYANSGSWCTNGIGDYDCEDGQGDGPNYAPRPVEVKRPGTDPFGLDDDNDGEGCEVRQAPEPEPEPEPEPDTDPPFDTCGEAIDAGYGPYYRGQDPEYDWYRDADSDGVVCE